MKSVCSKPAILIVVLLTGATATALLLRESVGSAKPYDRQQVDEPGPLPSEAPAAAAAPEAPPAGEARTNNDSRRQLLETLGALTAAHCYQCYFNLGLLADGKANGTYTAKDARHLLDTCLSILNSVDGKLAGLGRLDLDPSDRDSLEQARGLSALLQQQGKQLQAFWDSGKDDGGARYESARKDSWAALLRLTGAAQ